jgi:hypothetical protein
VHQKQCRGQENHVVVLSRLWHIYLWLFDIYPWGIPLFYNCV